ncbi:glycosyltransferase family 2 protein [Limosilactobacillus sp.]|uniref:glycosyltransferase family 2 protein n=1 Tax=Limosilactobacillus sp. TaxID=2773925 RepID=UPI003EFFA9B2
MALPKVSIIVPVYNDEKYLAQCIESALQQTYQNIELILVDDGSTDNSFGICEHYRQQDQRVRLLHKTNGGIGSSRNAGLAMAAGDYVTFIDDDDLLPKNSVADCKK